MCYDAAPKHLEGFLSSLDDGRALTTNIAGSGPVLHAKALEALDFLEERNMRLEAIIGGLDDTLILVTPYAKELREWATTL